MQQSTELTHSRARQQEVQRRVPTRRQTNQQNGRQRGHLPQQRDTALTDGQCRRGGRPSTAFKIAVRESHRANVRGHDVDELHGVIRQPADGEDHGGADQQGSGLLVAPVGGQRDPAAPQLGDDEAAVDGDAEQWRHVVNQEGRYQEEEPLVTANQPSAALVKVDVGDFGQRHGYRHQPNGHDGAQPAKGDDGMLGLAVEAMKLLKSLTVYSL